MKKELKIIRGLPGSGKSTLAEHTARVYRQNGKKVSHYEADQYFMKNGVYKFDASKLQLAHKNCANNVRIDLADKITQAAKDIVIVANTFTTYKEIEPYIELAYIYKISVDIIHCVSNFKSIHDVPEEAMERMRKRMVSNEYIVDKFKEMFNIEHDVPEFEISHQRYSKGI